MASAFAPVALLAALPVVAALLKQGPCLDRGWGGQEPFWRFCYSDLAVTTQTSGAGRGITAWLAGDVPLDQPPLTGAVVSLLAGLLPGDDVLATQRWVLGAWAVLGVIGLALMAWWVAGTRGHARIDPLHVVLAPVAGLTVLLAPDLLGVVLATGGLWAWTRHQPLLAGALLGTGTMARTYPALLVLVVATHAWRTGRERDLPRLGAGALAAVAAVAVPLVVLSPQTLARSWSGWFEQAAGLGSIWYLPTLAGSPWPASTVTVVALLGIALAIVLTGVFVLGAPRAPSLGSAALVAVAVVLVTGPAFPVQASLWLVPLVALAGLRWRDHLLWALAEGIHFVAIWLYLAGLRDVNRSLPPSWYAAALLLRVGAMLFLAVRAWRLATTPTFPPDEGSLGFAREAKAGEPSLSVAQSGPEAGRPTI